MIFYSKKIYQNIALGFCLFLCTSTQSMETIKKGLAYLGLYNEQPLTLAQKIAHAAVNQNEEELKQILLNGYDINQLDSVAFLEEVEKEVEKLLESQGKKPTSLPLFTENQQNALYEASLLVHYSPPLNDWLFSHGYRPKHIHQFAEHEFNRITRMVLGGNPIQWLQETLQEEGPYFPSTYTSKILLIAAGQGLKEVIKEMLTTEWNAAITNEMLIQALTHSALPGHSEIVQMILDALASRLIGDSLTLEELTDALRRALTWASAQGRVETVKLILEFAQMYDIGVGWEQFGDRVAAILENNTDLTNDMKIRLEQVLNILTEYTLARKRLIGERVRARQVSLERGLPEELAQHITSLISK